MRSRRARTSRCRRCAAEASAAGPSSTSARERECRPRAAGATGWTCSRRNVERAVDHFSGGNQQKVLLAKGLTRDVELFVFDEPTVGVDVGTRVRDLSASSATSARPAPACC